MSTKDDHKIYTRKGDKGKTGLIGGSIVPKYDLRVECYGTVDELNSIVGMVRDLDESRQFREQLIWIQQILFSIESQLAAESKDVAEGLPAVTAVHPTRLEEWIDGMNEGLPGISNFILPGGHPAVSWCHIARTVCRRAERLVVHLSLSGPVPEPCIAFLNRLSDYLFILARRLSYDLQAREVPWKHDT